MPDSGESRRFFDNSSPSVAAGDSSGDPIGPLMNLSAVSYRMDSLHSFLSDSINGNVLLGNQQMAMVSSEISSAIQQAIANGAALLAFCQIPNSASQNPNSRIPAPAKISEQKSAVDDGSKVEEPKPEPVDEELDEQGGKIDMEDDIEVIELDAVELLAEHVHFCEICGKGFKRDANLRMHMRAHGEQFKRPEALAKPQSVAVESSDPAAIGGGRKSARFSCPFAGCNRNRHHQKFRPLKSVICVRNHFKRSHCPKMYTCNRCNKKNFSVLSDLKSHLKHCGELKWRCSCGTTFSRKDKLFGHIALFEGHMPAIRIDDDENRSKSAEVAFMEEDGVTKRKSNEVGARVGVDDGFFDGLPDEFGEIDEKFIQQMLGSSASSSPDFNQHFYNF